MSNIQYFKIIFFLVFITNIGYGQSVSKIKYFTTYLDEFSGVKYEKENIAVENIAIKYNLDQTLFSTDSVAIKEIIRLQSNIGDVKLYKFYNSQSLLFLNNKIIKSSSINNNVIKVLYQLDLEAFLAFYSGKSSSNFPEINALKSQIQDANGVLNIEKLAAVIKANKTKLANYLDE